MDPRMQELHPKLADARAEREGLVLKAHRMLYDSTLGLRVIKKKKWGLDFTMDSDCMNSRMHDRCRVQGFRVSGVKCTMASDCGCWFGGV